MTVLEGPFLTGVVVEVEEEVDAEMALRAFLCLGSTLVGPRFLLSAISSRAMSRKRPALAMVLFIEVSSMVPLMNAAPQGEECQWTPAVMTILMPVSVATTSHLSSAVKLSAKGTPIERPLDSIVR